MQLNTSLTQYLHTAIPISKAMQIAVYNDAQGLLLKAPIAVNKNDKATAFAGSINSVATLAGWLWLDSTLREQGYNADVVIQYGNIHYQQPIHADFSAQCQKPDEVSFDKFLKMLKRRKRARIELGITVSSDNSICAELTGSYVVE